MGLEISLPYMYALPTHARKPQPENETAVETASGRWHKYTALKNPVI